MRMNSGIASSVKLSRPRKSVSARSPRLAAGMNAAMKPTETEPSANATGIPDRRRTRAAATNAMRTSFGVIGEELLGDLHQIFERQQDHAERDQRVRDPQRRSPDRIGRPAPRPGLERVGAHALGEQRAKQARQPVARQD